MVEATRDEFGHIVKAKTSIVGVILNTQAKVDETKLRRQSMDRLPGLMKLIEETARRLPAPVVHRVVDLVQE